MMNFKNYYPTNQFADLANVSTKSLGRLKKILFEANPNTLAVLKKNNKNYYHFTLLERFVSAAVYEIYRQRSTQYRNTDLCTGNQFQDEQPI